MTPHTRIVFENQHYVVCVTRAGLSVQRKRGRSASGRLLKPDSPQYEEWVKAFDTAIDASESNALARGFLG